MPAYVYVLDRENIPLRQFEGDGQDIAELIEHPPKEATYAMIVYRRGNTLYVFSFQLNTPAGIFVSYSAYYLDSVRFLDPTHDDRLVLGPQRFESIPQLIDIMYRLFPELKVRKEEGAEDEKKPRSTEKRNVRDTQKAGKRRRRRKTSRKSKTSRKIF
jgi:hypothetical protein